MEFIRLGTLIACARLVAHPDFDPKRFLHVCAALAMAAVPSALHARADLGSSLTFPPMIVGMLVAMGMRISHLLLLVGVTLAVAVGGMGLLLADAPKGSSLAKAQNSLLPREGP